MGFFKPFSGFRTPLEGVYVAFPLGTAFVSRVEGSWSRDGVLRNRGLIIPAAANESLEGD
jgi:hypothetical protein